MKKPNKVTAILSIIIILLVIILDSNAQKSHFTVSISPVIPFSIKNNANISFLSGNISYSYDLSKRISLCLTAGYTKFGTKIWTDNGPYYNNESNLAFIPVTTGIQFFFMEEGTRVYTLAKGGYFFPASDFIKGGWGISPGLGIKIPTARQLKFDLSLLYNAAFSCKTKDYKIPNGGITFTYNPASYLEINIGISDFLYSSEQEPVIQGHRSHFGVFYSPVIPFSMKRNANVGFLSGTINYSYDLTQKVSFCLSVAINKFGVKTKTLIGTDDEIESKLAFIPVMTGIQYFFNQHGPRVYILAKGGYFFPAADFNTGDWGISPGLGIRIPSKGQVDLDLSLLYNGVFGGTTNEYESTGSSNFYNWASYLAINIGVVI